MVEPSLEFLSRQIECVLLELASLCDSVDVLTAMATRHESSIHSVVQELAVIHRHNARAETRFRKLEDAATEENGK